MYEEGHFYFFEIGADICRALWVGYVIVSPPTGFRAEVQDGKGSVAYLRQRTPAQNL